MLKRYALTVVMLSILGFSSGCLFLAIPKHFPFPNTRAPAPAPRVHTTYRNIPRLPSTSPMVAKRVEPVMETAVVAKAAPVEPVVNTPEPVVAQKPVEVREPEQPILAKILLPDSQPLRKPLPATTAKPLARPSRAVVAKASTNSGSSFFSDFFGTGSNTVPHSVTGAAGSHDVVHHTASLGAIPDHPVARYSEFQSYLRCVHGAAINMDDNRRPVGPIVRNAIGKCGRQKSIAVSALSYPGMTGKVVVRAVDNGVYTLTLSKLLSRRLKL